MKCQNRPIQRQNMDEWLSGAGEGHEGDEMFWNSRVVKVGNFPNILKNRIAPYRRVNFMIREL